MQSSTIWLQNTESMVLKMRKMKDSGIEWIGEIPEGWEIVPVRSCFDEVRTKNTDGQEQNALQFKSGNIISKTNFNASMDDYVADTITNYTVVLPDTVMINGLNLNYDFKSLRVALVKEKGVITSAYLAIFPDRKKISPQYATYLFKGYETKMAFHNMGAGIRKTLGYKEFKNQPLLLPSKEEQNKISAYLDSKCSHIDTMLFRTRSGIEEYKKLKQAVITEAVTKGVRSEREMKDSGVAWIGEIPAEWSKCHLKNISSEIGDGLHGTPNFDDNGDVFFINGNNLGGEYVEPRADTKRINSEEFLKYTRPFFSNQTIMISLNGSYGKVSLYKNFPMLLGKSAGYITLLPSIDCRYIKYYLSSTPSQIMMTLSLNGTTIPNLSLNTLRNFSIFLPVLCEQKEVADYLDAKCAEIDGLIAKKECLVKELESYKKSLIYEVVTGKREV